MSEIYERKKKCNFVIHFFLFLIQKKKFFPIFFSFFSFWSKFLWFFYHLKILFLRNEHFSRFFRINPPNIWENTGKINNIFQKTLFGNFDWNGEKKEEKKRKIKTKNRALFSLCLFHFFHFDFLLNFFVVFVSKILGKETLHFHEKYLK